MVARIFREVKGSRVILTQAAKLKDINVSVKTFIKCNKLTLRSFKRSVHLIYRTCSVLFNGF